MKYKEKKHNDWNGKTQIERLHKLFPILFFSYYFIFWLAYRIAEFDDIQLRIFTKQKIKLILIYSHVHLLRVLSAKNWYESET